MEEVTSELLFSSLVERCGIIASALRRFNGFRASIVRRSPLHVCSCSSATLQEVGCLSAYGNILYLRWKEAAQQAHAADRARGPGSGGALPGTLRVPARRL